MKTIGLVRLGKRTPKGVGETAGDGKHGTFSRYPYTHAFASDDVRPWGWALKEHQAGVLPIQDELSSNKTQRNLKTLVSQFDPSAPKSQTGEISALEKILRVI